MNTPLGPRCLRSIMFHLSPIHLHRITCFEFQPTDLLCLSLIDMPIAYSGLFCETGHNEGWREFVASNMPHRILSSEIRFDFPLQLATAILGIVRNAPPIVRWIYLRKLLSAWHVGYAPWRSVNHTPAEWGQSCGSATYAIGLHSLDGCSKAFLISLRTSGPIAVLSYSCCSAIWWDVFSVKFPSSRIDLSADQKDIL